MKKTWTLPLFVAVLTAVSLARSARAQNDVYAVEFNTSDNGFGVINLMNGDFTEIADLGSTLYNDIAYAPDGTLYGLANNGASLVTFDSTTGDVTPVASLAGGIESIAFNPNNGVLYGASESGLYTIDPTSGQTSYIGDFGNPYGCNTWQNIRFDSDGNLYLSNTGDSTGTDIYQVNTSTGSATFEGEVEGYSDMVLENGSQYMYGVSIPSINGADSQPVLVAFNLDSFVNGGTNADGSINQISVTMVGSGGDFPINYNFSGNVPNPLPVNIPDACEMSIVSTPNGPAISLSGSTNQIYVIEASIDMHNWTAITTNSTDATGLFMFVDSDATNYPQRYYRGFAPAQVP